MTNVRNLTDLAGRVLIAAMFLVAGLGKITGYAGTQAYMAAAGVPGALLPAVIVLEVLGGAAIMAGWHTRAVAAALALFSIVASKRGCATPAYCRTPTAIPSLGWTDLSVRDRSARSRTVSRTIGPFSQSVGLPSPSPSAAT